MQINQTKTLYHYTTMSTLCSLLNNLEFVSLNATNTEEALAQYKLKFWISDNCYMNDPTERYFFLNSLGNALDFYQKKHCLLDKTTLFELGFSVWDQMQGYKYILSLSECRDSLSMWRAYGANGQGVALGFNVEKLQEFIVQSEALQLFKVNYIDTIDCINSFSDRELQKMYDSIEMKNNGDGSCSMEVIQELTEKRHLYYKNEAYKDEREWRIVSITNGNCYFRERTGIIVPYCELGIPINILDSIIIGPCAEQKRSKYTLSRMFYHKVGGLVEDSRIPIINSNIPYTAQ